MHACDIRGYALDGATYCVEHTPASRRRISAERPWDGERIIHALADVLAADNPRFRREQFISACETGDMREPHRIPPMPICAQAMGCLCAGHARNPRRKTCDTRELAR